MREPVADPASPRGAHASGTQQRSYRTELSPVSFLRRSAYVFPEKIAVVHGERRTTYCAFEERANRLASALRSAGIEPGDRVAILSPNTPAMLEAHYGIPMMGAVMVPINTRLGAGEIRQIIEHSGARLLFADHELGRQVSNIGVDVIRIDDTGAPGDPYEDFLAGGSPEQVELQLDDEEQTISINYTSGTTGSPKGVMTTHRGSYLNALMEGLQANLRPESVQLWVVPMFHCNGWCFPWSIAANAGTNVCLRKVDAEQVFALIRAEGVTHYSGAPIVHTTLINAPAALREGITQKVHAMVAGAAPPESMIEGMERIGFDLTHVYGLTETYGPAAVCARQAEWDSLELAARAERNGRQGFEYLLQDGMAVLDPETLIPVPADGVTMGEIMFRGNITMKGYLKNPAATAAALKGGWFHSGDLAVVQPDGYAKIRDRSKDIIISGGENISSLEVEEALYRHPAVLAAAVVAKPDPKWGETPCAFIELKDGARATAEELRVHCEAHLARFKVPKAFEFLPLPRTATGKIQKQVLRGRAREP